MKHLGYRFGATCLARMANDRRIAFHSKHFVNTCYPTELMMNR